jgi:dipeptidyl aminopeptidase/acylaminoacyl peptidase
VSPSRVTARWGALAKGVALLAVTVALAVAVLQAWIVVERTLPALHPFRLPVDPDLARALGPVEEVAVSSEGGVVLRGWYVPSRNGAAVVFAHGLEANRTQLVPLAAPLVRAGFGALLLDSRAHGESGGDRCTLGWREQADLRAALEFLGRRRDVAPGRVGIVGYSVGGLAGGLVAARDGRIRAVALAATFGSLSELVAAEEHAWTAPIAWATLRVAGIDLDAVRLEPALCDLAPRPLLLIFGSEDTTATPALGRRLVSRACDPASLEIVPGADHAHLPAAAGERLGARLVAFFEAGLAPRP